MFRRVLGVALFVLSAVLPASAQLYVNGNEPASVRWNRIDTPDYKIVYPRGMDSIAVVYARLLEQVKAPVGATAGFLPNQNSRRRMPVILHPWTASSNGMVTWTPKRMELYTTPDFSAPLPSPWEEHLVVHESRHVAQMQFMNAAPYRPYNWLFGQLFSGAAAAIYCGPAFYEGDAVAAETELSHSGRGRNAAFLEYYRSAFLAGDVRDYWQWRYGSLRKYTPDYYTIGYISAAGARSIWGEQDFTKLYYERLFRHKAWPWPLFNYQKTVREVSGKKFSDAFAEICDTLQRRWREDEVSRGPSMPSRLISVPGRHYTDISATTVLDSVLYSVQSGMALSPVLLRVDGSRAGRFAYGTSALKPSEPLGRIYWSEIVRDPRWELVSYSEIWYSTPGGRKHCLKPRTRWYNPAVSPDGRRLAVTEYPAEGGSAILVVDACDGTVRERFDAPSGMQAVESEWLGDDIFACAITSSGQGIYNVRDGFSKELDCGYNTVKNLFSGSGSIWFTSDLNGVDELYSFTPGSGEAWRISSTGGGASSFCFSPQRDSLYFSAQTPQGRFLYVTPADSLPTPVRADFGVRHRYEFADDLEAPLPVDYSIETEMSAPRPYSRLANAFRLHSWAPVYVNYDAVESLSFSSITTSAGLGATAFFQNDLSTFYGMAAYNAYASGGEWQHRAEVKLTCRAFYPVLELSAGVDTEKAVHYYLYRRFYGSSLVQNLVTEDLSVPSADASLLLYVPLNFSSGGWYRGVVPQLRWAVSNSILTVGRPVLMNRLSASLRAYAVTATPASCIYPKLGVGAELGWSGRPGATGLFAPNTYVYAYGYLPGLMPTHGIRMTATVQTPLGNGAGVHERYVAVAPRGMSSGGNAASRMAQSPFQSRITVDYAFPFASIDWSGLCPVAYVRNLEAILHADYGFAAPDLHLGSVGADVCVVLGNFLWIPYDTRIGLSYYFNAGPSGAASPHELSAVFSVSF